MAVVRDFWAKVAYTDAEGEHPAGTLIRVPYSTDTEIANAQSMVSYGVLTEQQPPPPPPPPNDGVPVVAPPSAPQVLVPNDEAAVVAEQPDEDVLVVVTPNDENPVAHDDPATPYFDARDDSGEFVREGTPVKKAPAPQKKAARKRR